jgi:ubiquinone biosynthesis protein
MRRAQKLGRFRRLIQIAGPLARYTLRYHFLRRRKKGREFITPSELRLSLEALGGTFLKFGQLLSMRSDYIPLDYCLELQKLLDQVPPFPFEAVQDIIMNELGKEANQVFDHFEPRPFASASFGQVHLARLKSGEKVAVKAQRPGLRTIVEQDIRIMYLLARLLDWTGILGATKAETAVDEFAKWTFEELDYTIEGRTADLLRLNARDNPKARIPKIFWDYSRRRILTMEFLEGISVNGLVRAIRGNDARALARYRRLGIDNQMVAKNLHSNELKQILVDGLFHADPHPANLLILKDNAIGYVDFGIVGRFDESTRKIMREYMKAIARGDLQETYEALLKVGITTSRTDLKGLERNIKRRTKQWHQAVSDGEGSVEQKSMARYMVDTMRIAQAHELGIPLDILIFYRTVVAIDSVNLQIAPSFDALEDAREFFKKWEIDNLLRTLSVPSFAEVIQDFYGLCRDLPGKVNTVFKKIEGDGLVLKSVETESRELLQIRNRRMAMIMTAGVALLLSIVIHGGTERAIFHLPVVDVVMPFFILTCAVLIVTIARLK